MKKYLTILALVGLVSSASAVSVEWKSAAVSFGGEVLKKDTAVTGYLVYLASGSLASTYKIDDSFTAASVGTIVSSDTDGTSKGGNSQGVFQFDFGSYDNGDKFALVISYAAPDGKKYWNLSETINTLAGISDETSSPTEFSNFAVNSSSSSTPGKMSGGSGWTAVPEPSTAMLALAGLALLIKRRRA